MDRFFHELLSFSFKVLPVFILVWFVIKILRHLTIEKYLQALTKVPDDRKERIVRVYGNIISMNRIALWISLFGLLMLLTAFVLLSLFPEIALSLPDVYGFVLLGGILFVVTLIHFSEDTYYKSRIVKAIKKPAERITS